MAYLPLRRSGGQLIGVFGVVLVLLGSPVSLRAQQAPALSGRVVDDSGAVLTGARVTVSDRRDVVVRTTVTDAAGAFTVERLAPGTYAVVVEMSRFAPFARTVTIPDAGAAQTLLVVLSPGAVSESVVVTARRVGTLLSETPQKVEVVDAADIDRSVAADVTDVLKKNSGVDVIQYTGALSGIGIRGFRPQFSGVNKRSLLLIDGRPSGVTNLATLLLDNVERIEVLKGAASAVYGSSAMGGVVNVITRRSQGRIGGNARLGGGSFSTSEAGGRLGGNLTRQLDFDVVGSAFNQRDDIRMGNGVVRPATGFKTYTVGGRVGVDLATGWRLEGNGDAYRGRDVNSPPDIAAGIVGQSRKNIERNGGDVRLGGWWGAHAFSATGYRASESSHTSNVTTSNPLDGPFLPYLSFESQLTWTGAQVKDVWAWLPKNTLVTGLDYERVDSVSRSFARTGEAAAPFSANYNKRTVGVYVENTTKFSGDRTVVTLGGRFDHITSETLDTPLRTNFTPSASTFNVFNPSLGLSQRLGKGFRGHLSAGRAFIPAEASMLTGFTTTVVAGRTQINQGNPDLKPERSTSVDGGLEWTASRTRLDVTAFRTVVKDRFVSNVTISSPPPPDPIVLTVQNGLDANISGIDVEAAHRVTRHVGVFLTATHYFRRNERLANGLEQVILNVPSHTWRTGVDLDLGRLSARFSGRFVRDRQDNDFNMPGFPIVDYDDLSVFDATAAWRLGGPHSVNVSINNIFDAFYYEKIGYPLQGASARVYYRLGF